MGRPIHPEPGKSPGSTLNVMHASLAYVGRSGVKCYLSSRVGTRFVFILFDNNDSSPLAVMGADILGRYRTGAASAVATRALFKDKEVGLCAFRLGKTGVDPGHGTGGGKDPVKGPRLESQRGPC
jgi:ornithine cyclodeaminase/alanine dehydrogenase-like protein (mu-crystallin family)